MDIQAAHVNIYVRRRYVAHTIYGGQFIEMGSPCLHLYVARRNRFLAFCAYVEIYKGHNFSASGDARSAFAGLAGLGRCCLPRVLNL